MAASKDVIDKVRSVAVKYGVPEWVWLPILNKESGGDPNSHADTSTEDSRGLFQINIKANPQWAGTDLYDPATNAKIAFENFIAPAWDQVKNRSDLTYQDKTAYVWKEGIRPKWTDEKDKAIRQEAAKVFGDGLGWTNNLGNNIGDALTNWTRGLFGWISGEKVPTIQEEEQQRANEPPKTPSSDPDKVTILKDSWLTPEIAFSKSKLTTIFIIGAIAIVGIYLLFIFLKSLGNSPAVVVSEGSTLGRISNKFQKKINAAAS